MADQPLIDSNSTEVTPLGAVWRFRWLVLTLTLLGGAVALLYAMGLLPPRYEATASLVVTDPRAATLFSATETAAGEAERYVADQKAILGSDAVAERASEMVAVSLPATAPPPRDIAKEVRITTSNSNEIKIVYAAEDEATAMATVNAVIEAYELLRGESANRDSASAIAQLDESLADIDEELSAIRVQVIVVRDNPRWVQLDSQYQEALDRLAELQPQLRSEDGSNLLGLQAEVVVLDEQLKRIDGIVRLADSDQTAVVFNAAQRAALDAQYDDAIDRLAEIQPLLRTAEGSALIALQAEIEGLDKQIERLTEIALIEATDPVLDQLSQQETEALARRRVLAEERDRLLIDTRLLSGGITLSSPAQFATEANSTKPITMLGAALGFLAGAGLAYLLMTRNRKITDRAQPSWILHTKLLAEIPHFYEDKVTDDVPVSAHPGSVTAEAFRFAATTLDLELTQSENAMGGETDSVHSFLVTSAGPGDGKTVLAANLALAAARKGRSVLAIDADFGNQRLTELLGGPARGGPGITEVVEAGLPLHSAAFSVGPPGATLSLLSRGQRRVTAPDFFSLPAASAFIREVGELYDIVLIDGPPMLHVAYASGLALDCDRVIAVVRHSAYMRQIEDLSQRLDMIGTPLAGYVYNAAPLRKEMTLTEGSLKDVLGDAIPVDVRDSVKE
jgi:Mrp family chromosome partitioning ATPase/capsular polysaccharide biosynthesis protein